METPVLLRHDSNELIRYTFEYRRVSFKQIAQTHLCLDVSVIFFCCSQVQQLASTGLWQNMHQNRNTGSSSCIVHHIIGRTCISTDTPHHHHTQYKNSTSCSSSSSCTRSNLIHTQEHQNLVSYPAGPWFIFHSTIDIFCSNIIKTWIVAMKLSFRVDHLGHYEGGNPFSNLDHYILVDGICHHFKILCISVKYFQNKAQINIKLICTCRN